MKAMTHRMLPLCLMLSLMVSHGSAAADAAHAPRSRLFQVSIPKIATKATLATATLPLGVTLRDIDGGPQYFTNKDPRSAWMDSHILLGAWIEQPVDATQVGYAVGMGENIYWNLGGKAGDPSQLRADYDVIRTAGMHVSAPDTTPNSGSETVSYDGWDEADMQYGAGANGWNPTAPNANLDDCIPAGSECGYTVAKWSYTGQPTSYGSPGYPINNMAKHQGYGKGVLFWMWDSEAAVFLGYSDILSADSYWMTDPDLEANSQGGCAFFPSSEAICSGANPKGITHAQRALPANYAFNVTRLQTLSTTLNHQSKPVVVDVETGCPIYGGTECITPPAMKAAAMHGLIAGARGILWFQHNFSGPCTDNTTLIDGSDPSTDDYNCQQTPGVTIHNVVQNIAAFNQLVNSLNNVLLSPFADGYVSQTGNVSAMAKYDGSHFYIFAASGTPATPPPANQSVTFTVKSSGATKVTVVNEGRTIPLVNGTTFTDTFANANAYHIYRMD